MQYFEGVLETGNRQRALGWDAWEGTLPAWKWTGGVRSVCPFKVAYSLF